MTNMTTLSAAALLGLIVGSLAEAQPAVPGPASAPAVVVDAETVAATLGQSVANNTLDKKMAETSTRGGIVRIGIVHRTKPEPRALLHNELTEIYQILQGSGTLHTGGAAQEARPVADPPNLGPTPSFFVTQDGGTTQKVKKGDLVVIPAGLPHRFSELDGPMDYVIYRFEAVPVKH